MLRRYHTFGAGRCAAGDEGCGSKGRAVQINCRVGIKCLSITFRQATPQCPGSFPPAAGANGEFSSGRLAMIESLNGIHFVYPASSHHPNSCTQPAHLLTLLRVPRTSSLRSAQHATCALCAPPPPPRRDRARRARVVSSALCSRPPQPRWRSAAPSGRTECLRRRDGLRHG